MKQTSTGFTLIELIVVIAIVGILAAVALPRFINAQADARVAKAQALFGAVRSASALAHARCVLDLSGTNPAATCTNTVGTVNMEGLAVAAVNQYPAGHNAGNTDIVAAAGINAANDNVTLSAPNANPTTITIVGATTAASCRISYTQATAAVPPVITLTTAGC